MKVSLCNIKNWFARGSGCLPVGLHVLGNVFASFLQLKFIQNHIKIIWITKFQLVGAGNLSIHMTGLCASSRFYQPKILQETFKKLIFEILYFTQNTSIIEADQVPGSAFSLPLKHFCAGNLQVDHDWSQGRLCKLTRMVDGVTVHHDQLHCATQLENSLYLGLNFGQIRCSRTVFLQNFPV